MVQSWKNSQVIDNFIMDKQGRHNTSGMLEDQYMAESNETVLKNLLNIVTNQEIDRVETELLFVLTDQLIDEFDRDRCFSADDLLTIHSR